MCLFEVDAEHRFAYFDALRGVARSGRGFARIRQRSSPGTHQGTALSLFPHGGRRRGQFFKGVQAAVKDGRGAFVLDDRADYEMRDPPPREELGPTIKLDLTAKVADWLNHIRRER
jgi:hypothetical protein